MRWKHTVFIAVILGLSLCLLVLTLSLTQSRQNFPFSQFVQRGSAFDPDNESRLRDISANKISQRVSSSIPIGFVPIEVSLSYSLDTSSVTLCKLDFELHAEHPSQTPMFKDLVRASKCSGPNVIHTTLADLEMQDTRLTPTGFIFHESRCGSTLVANILASDPSNIVYSESQPPSNIALHCDFCTTDYRARALRAVIKGMGNVDTTKYKRLFFKFQSVNSASINRYLDVFPSVPWIFLYRDPVEVLASYFESGKEAPLCARSRSSPPMEIQAVLQFQKDVSFEQYCAAYLHMLCKNIIRETTVSHNGVVVNYKNIRDQLLDVVFPNHFGYEISDQIRARMLEEASTYSKSRDKVVGFQGDSERKRNEASEALKLWAKKYVQPLYNELEEMSKQQLAQLRGKEKPVVASNGRSSIDYKYVDENNKDADLGRWIVQGKVDRYGEKNINQYLRYPKLRPLRELLEEWNPDEPDVPPIPGIEEGTLARFNFSDPQQRLIAEVYRLHEVPFMLTDVPNAKEVMSKWGDDEYLKKRFGRLDRKVTFSNSNHFMYYNKKSLKDYTSENKDYKPPTSLVEMPFETWLTKAYAAEKITKDDPHFYLQLNAEGLDRWIQDDLTMFEPEHSFFMIEEELNRGINCRFGTRGIIAEAHYDGGRNFIAMLRGAKRYILLPPSECKLMELYPRGHPEARHSSVDWSNVDWKAFNSTLGQAQAAQVVLRAGEVMYLPSYWFHYIVSTGISIQCNSRSGNALRGRNILVDCGFY